MAEVLKAAQRGHCTGLMMRELTRGVLLSKTTGRESDEGWLRRLHQQQQFAKAVKHQRTAKQQPCSLVNAQVLTVTPHPLSTFPRWCHTGLLPLLLLKH